MGCRFLLQGIFPSQGLNLCLLILNHWATREAWLLSSLNKFCAHRNENRASCNYQYRFLFFYFMWFFLTLYVLPVGKIQTKLISNIESVWFQFSSVTQSSLTLCGPMDCSTPSLPVHQQLPGVYSNSCPLNWWCHPIISSSVIPFSRLQSFPASGSFLMSHFFASGGQSIGVPPSATVLPINIQDWFLLGWTGSPYSPRDPQESLPTPQLKSVNSSALSFLYSPTLTTIHDDWKNHRFE